MANRTAKDAKSIKGTNPQYLIEKIIRMRIYDSRYWKEECFALSAELIVDKGMELRYVGGIYGGNIKPTPFLCLVLKMLQIQPDKDIVVEFIRQEDFKYVRALGAFYMRLTGNSVENYKYLEPLYNDFRKLRFMNKTGQFELLHMDEFVDKLLIEDIVCDITLPRIQRRQVLEETGELQPRVSALEEDLDELSESSSDEDSRDKRRREIERKTHRRSRSPEEKKKSSSHRDRERRRSRSRDRHERKRSRSHERRRSDKDRDSHRHKHDSDRKEKRKDTKDDELDIKEANELRRSLGLAPLER